MPRTRQPVCLVGCNGLTDYGVDHVTGEILQWNDPTGQAHPSVSANRAAWASDPVPSPYGDGPAFLRDNGGDVNVVNRDQVSIEISGLYEDPISDERILSVAALSAYYADQFGIRGSESRLWTFSLRRSS